MTAPDPFDVGAMLRAALVASGCTAAEVARATGLSPSHLSRALRDPNARPPTARRILAALGHHVEAVADRRGRKRFLRQAIAEVLIEADTEEAIHALLRSRHAIMPGVRATVAEIAEPVEAQPDAPLCSRCYYRHETGTPCVMGPRS